MLASYWVRGQAGRLIVVLVQKGFLQCPWRDAVFVPFSTTSFSCLPSLWQHYILRPSKAIGAEAVLAKLQVLS